MDSQTEPLLRYMFARDHGFAVKAKSDQQAQVVMREGADPLMLAEVRRALAVPLSIEVMEKKAFDTLLSDIHAALKSLITFLKQSPC